METNNEIIPEPSKPENNWGSHSPSGRVMGGLVIVIVGSAFLAHRIGYTLPEWMFTWKMLLIVVGVYIGAKHSFRGGKWLIPIAVGSIFLLFDTTEIASAQIFWPVVIILIGVLMIFRPKRNHRERWARHWKHEYYANSQNSSEDVLDTVTVFGSMKKNIISKQFKGGESVCVFGGTELNLMQADIEGRVVLEVVQVFGGTKIIVPSNWQVQGEEMVSIFGGLEDKRPMPSNINADNNKVLVLRGTCLFGGIDLRSY